jgi:hypothetical protein
LGAHIHHKKTAKAHSPGDHLSKISAFAVLHIYVYDYSAYYSALLICFMRGIIAKRASNVNKKIPGLKDDKKTVKRG